MRFFYADPALRDGAGHHANTCRTIGRELRRHGVTPSVFGFHEMGQGIRAELGATPHFRYFSYTTTDGDPICGWLNAFVAGGQLLHEDLERLQIGRDDVLFCATVVPALLFAIARWLHGRPKEQWPQVLLDLGTDTGLDAIPSANGSLTFAARDPRVDARATLYRFAGKQLPQDATSRLHILYPDPFNARAFSDLLQYPVSVMPFLCDAVGALRRRGTQRPLTVVVMGHQQPIKGYHLVPEIAVRVLQTRADCRVVLHNSAPAQMPDIQDLLRKFAEREPRLVLDEGPIGTERWEALYEGADVILCAYDPQHYRMMPSAVGSEAVGHAVPVVGPAGTSLERLMRDYDAGGALFERFEAASIAAAVLTVLDDIDIQAERALTAASKWWQRNGSAHAVELLLSKAGHVAVTAPRA